MSGICHYRVFGVGPCVRELIGGHNRAHHVIARLHDRRWQMAYAIEIVQKLVGRQETLMGKVVRFHPRQAERLIGKVPHQFRIWQQGRARTFVFAPCARKRQIHPRIGVEQSLEVSL